MPLQPAASALPRPLDFSYASNRAAAAGFGLGVAAAKLLGRTWPGSLRVGLGTFTAWAIARELDPDEPVSALWAMPLALAASLGLPRRTRKQPEGLGSLRHALPGLTALSSLRALVSSVGPAVSSQDVTALGAQAALTALSSGQITRILPAAALLSSGQLPDHFQPPAGSGLTLLVAAAAPRLGSSAGHQLLSDLLSVGALGLSSALSAPETINSRCDVADRHISAERVRAARLLSLGTLAVGLLRGESLALSPLAAACLGVGLRRLLATKN